MENQNLETRTCEIGECPDAHFALHLTGLRCGYKNMNLPVVSGSKCRYDLKKEKNPEEDYIFENGTPFHQTLVLPAPAAGENLTQQPEW